jgi:N-acetylneuraminic acid mutarotase
MHHPNVAVVGNKLYVLGGISGLINWRSVPNSYEYDPATNKWKTIEPMPNPRGSAAVGVHGSTVYLAGGLQTREANAKGRLESMAAVDVVSSYDTISGKWTSHPDLKLPEARDHGGGVVLGDTFYFVGGRVGNPQANRGTLFALNVTSPKPAWTQLATMPSQRGGIAVAAIANKIYVFGGEGNPASGSRGVFPNGESYDVSRKTWERELPMKTPRHGTAAVAIGNTIYIAGGGAEQHGGDPVDTNEAYTLRPC